MTTHREPWGAPELFIISQTVLPAMLYVPGTQPFRLPLRVGAFLISFGLLVYWYFRRPHEQNDTPHPARPWITAMLVLVGLMIFHPSTSTLAGGLASLGLYVCVVAPLYWAPGMVRTPTRLRRVMALLLVCNGLNASVGVLQVYDPERWLPDEFSRVVTESEMGLGAVSYEGRDGRQVVRPPGLFDTPGGVAGPGAYAALLGLIFAATRFRWWQRLACVGLAFAGLAAIYLSHVRVSMVVAAGMIAAYAFILLVQRRSARATLFTSVAGVMLVGAFTFAVLLGGTATFERVRTLLAGDPLDLYYQSRGGQLAVAFNESLFMFPFGAGLARWGMAGAYFGAPTLDRPPLWAEIQFAGWILDGGVLLMVLFSTALAVEALTEYRLARRSPDPLVAACAAAVFAANLGPIAMCASFTPFVTQIGVQYWFLAGALYGVAQGTARAAPERAEASYQFS